VSDWRDRYVYISPYALQVRTFRYHSPFSSRGHVVKSGGYPVLVLREHMETISGARPCRKCLGSEVVG
jgi:hypothetical protein